MIGLFLGDTDFSEIVLKKIIKLKKKYFIIDFSKNNKFKKNRNSNRISIGKFGEIINLIKEKKSNKVLFAGKIAKPKFSTLRLDLKGIYYMPSVIKAAKSGDAAIIKAIIKILEREKIKVISSIFYNAELSLKAGNYTKIKPTLRNMKSIKRGVIYLNHLNNLDHVQALVVNDEKVIATEGNQGTKKMLSELKKASDGILIKLPKKKQDLRMDLPTIGLNTLKDCKKYGLKGIVLKSKKNIFLDKVKCINFANKNKIFIKNYMKKIFILTGEPSGDKLASTVISKLMIENPDVEYLSVGGSHIKRLGIQSIFDLKEITYLGFTSVLLNIFKIRNRINKTVDEIIKFNPDILFSVDSPDFTLRVAERVKKINNNIKNNSLCCSSSLGLEKE